MTFLWPDMLWLLLSVPAHPLLSKQVTERLGYSLPDEAYEVPEPVIPPKPEDDSDEAAPDDDAEKANPPVKASLAAVTDARLQSFRSKWWVAAPNARPLSKDGRAPMRLEAEVCSLGAVGDAMRTGERDLYQALSDARWLAIEELMRRVAAGKFTRRNIESQARSAFKAREKAMKQVVSALHKVGASGRDHVREEIEKQEKTR